MPITVIVGGQFGSEGKGKVAHAWAQRFAASVAVRVGGSNSGHTVQGPAGRLVSFRHLPTPCLLPKVLCVIPAGSYLDVRVLKEEIKVAKLTPKRLVVDPYAAVISESHKQVEAVSGLTAAIGSTGSGTGACLQHRVGRLACLKFAKDIPELASFVADTRERLRSHLRKGERVIIEGTQGFGLSLLHSENYPRTTSRDTTAAAFVSEAGVSPLDVDQVVLVIRSFPIRVAGDSGPLPREVTWPVVTAESGSMKQLVERTTVTNKVRRIGRFDGDVVRKAIISNRPTHIVMNHLDYIDVAARDYHRPTALVWGFVRRAEIEVGQKFDFLGFDKSSVLCPAIARDVRVAQ
ncbi:MAG: adenylosuccinate synthetase [Verrucomicrobia bacterium]|jgi:adenylosuccinate synthase|nr:adenylosuccinate synthetase [Verrucomicrobiota bacterium]